MENRPFHILTVISRLMSGFTETPSVVPAYERSVNFNKFLNIVSANDKSLLVMIYIYHVVGIFACKNYQLE